MTQAEIILDFLKDLAANNNREWFAEHKPRYIAAAEVLGEVIDRLIAGLGAFDDDVKYLHAKDCTYRIYRDIRFSPDKSPYKRHMAAYIARGGRKSIRPGYYLHLQPGGESLLAGGLYCMDSKMVKAARRAIDDNREEFLEIVSEPSFKENFVFAGDRLKRMPLGFEQDSSVAEYLKYKDFTVMHKLSDDFFNNEGWEGQIVEWCEVLKPYNDFMNAALDDYYNV